MTRFDIALLGRWVKKTGGNMDVAVRKTVFDISEDAILRTPVDSGRARANWQVGINNKPSGVIEFDGDAGSGISSPAPSKGGDMAISAATEAVRSPGMVGSVVYITNNLPYIEKLEFGHSDQAPQGMARLAVAAANSMLKKNISRLK